MCHSRRRIETLGREVVAPSIRIGSCDPGAAGEAPGMKNVLARW